MPASYNWTEEYFVVTKVVRGNPNCYYISDTEGEEFEGQAFYAKDLQLVQPNLDTWISGSFEETQDWSHERGASGEMAGLA